MAKGSCFGHKPHFTSIPGLWSFYLLESWYENTFIFFFPRRKWPFWLCCVHFHFQTRRRLHTSPLIPQPHFSPQGSLLFQEIQSQLQVPGRWRQECQKNPLVLFYKCNFYTYILCVCMFGCKYAMPHTWRGQLVWVGSLSTKWDPRNVYVKIFLVIISSLFLSFCLVMMNYSINAQLDIICDICLKFWCSYL